MATVLPGSPPSFNRNDVEGTVKALCNYTRSLQENIDFMLGQLKKDVAATGKRLDSLNSAVSAMSKTVSSLQVSVSDLSSNYNKLAAHVSALEQKMG